MAVLAHPHSEVAISLVHSGDTAAQLSAVGVAFGQHALSQLDEQVDLLLGVLGGLVAQVSRHTNSEHQEATISSLKIRHLKKIDLCVCIY